MAWRVLDAADGTHAGVQFRGAGCGLGDLQPAVCRAVFTAALGAVDRRLLDASASLGASGWRTFWRITFPLALPGIITGFALSFAHTLGEFGVVLMLGGNIPGRTRTASIAIYDNVQMLDYAEAARQSFMLIAISFALLVLINALNRRSNWRLR